MTKFKYIKDILDSKGKKKNFLNENKYSKEYISLGQFWSKLPLYEDEKKGAASESKDEYKYACKYLH